MPGWVIVAGLWAGIGWMAWAIVHAAAAPPPVTAWRDTSHLGLPVPPPLPRRNGFVWDARQQCWIPLDRLVADLEAARTVDDVLRGTR